MTYTLIANRPDVTRDADGATIPADPANGDWQAYQAWCAAGNVANPAPAAGPAAPTVTGNQWAFALKTCKVASPWRAACARATDADQIRLELISRSTSLQLDDPLLVRVAALATPPIDVPTVMTCAQGMPL